MKCIHISKNFDFQFIIFYYFYPESKFTYAFVPTQGKLERMNFDSIQLEVKKYGITLIGVNLSFNLDQIQKIDLIAQKAFISDLLCVQDQNLAFYNFCQKHKEIPIIDSIDAVTFDRAKLKDLLFSASFPEECELKIPRFTHIKSNDPQEIQNSLFSLHFPVFAKPLQETENVAFHHLLFATSLEHLQRFSAPFFVQEYSNQGGVIFKAYSMSEKVFIGKRNSTKDISKEENFEFSLIPIVK
jgi:hypothetical protein